MNVPINFELAKLLKEKNFDNESSYYFNKDGEILFDRDFPSLQPTKPKEYYDVPLISEVVMWLYEKYKIWISVSDAGGFGYMVQFMKTDGDSTIDGLYEFNSPTEAYEAAIFYILKKLN